MEPLTDEMDFGGALNLLKEGYRVARKGWNGKGLFLFLVPGSENLQVNREPLLSALGEGARFDYEPHIDLFTPGNRISTWSPSNSDALAEDWVWVPDADGH